VSGEEPTSTYQSQGSAEARRIVDGAGQAGYIIIDGRGQVGLTPDIARRAIARALGADARLLFVRILGEGFDIVVPRVAG
jgi:hypothetical protein